MGLLDTLANNKNTGSTNTRTRRPTEDRPEAKTWLNVGYEVDGKFVNLPLGLPIDTMEGVSVRGQNIEWVQLQHARNELLAAIQEAGDNLAPGQEQEIPLVVRIRRVNAEIATDSETNPFSMANAGLKMVAK